MIDALTELLNQGVGPPDPRSFALQNKEIQGLGEGPPSINSAPERYVEQSGKHKGVAGIGRDVLGFLGDFLLTRMRMPAMYAPAQERRREAAAIQGFDQDPVKAIQRLESINPEAGSKLRNTWVDNNRQAASLAATQEAANLRQQQLNRAELDRTRGIGRNMMATVLAAPPDKQQALYASVRDRFKRAHGETPGLNIDQELPETFYADDVKAWVYGDTPVGTQDRNQLIADQGGERIEVTQKNAETAEKALKLRREIATKPPRATKIQTSVGEDGYQRTVMSDGSIVVSPVKVRETKGSSGRRVAPVGGLSPSEVKKHFQIK